MSKKRLGELLLEAGLISPEKLNLALERQRNSREKLGQILVELGLINMDQLIEFLGKQHGVKSLERTH